VRVTYMRKADSHSSTIIGIWHSGAGNFIIEAGHIPGEIIKAFDLPAGAVAKNGTSFLRPKRRVGVIIEAGAHDVR